jgi:transcriptional regulator GlxA family with amidase domain
MRWAALYRRLPIPRGISASQIGAEHRFPKIKIEVGKLLIDHGDVFTAGGVMAWVDLGLRWIEKLMSPTAMLASARFVVVDPPRLDQRLYTPFFP